MAKRMTDSEIKVLVSQEIRQAKAYDEAELSAKRADAIAYFLGDMQSDTPPIPNRSTVVSRDTATVIKWMLPGIMRTFAASGRMCEFEPQGREDEGWADQASDYLHHVFWKANDGYRVLYSATHDALLLGNGIVKHTWDDTPCYTKSFHSGLTDIGFAQLTNDPEVEVIEHAETVVEEQQTDPQTGQPVNVPVTYHDVTVQRMRKPGKVVIDVIEPENFLMSKDSVTIEEARFVAHREFKTRTDLIAMGFQRSVIDSLPAYTKKQDSEEAFEREESRFGEADEADRSMEEIEVYEAYVKADINGDGQAETVRVWYAGDHGAGRVLDWEEWEDDEFPFTDIPCEPIPHRFDAQSVFDDTRDIQRIKTVLTRQLLDNVYASNLPGYFVREGSIVNPDSLTNQKFGGVTVVKEGTEYPQPRAVPFVADKALLAIQHIDTVIEQRTGISRATMALDPEALSNQTATAVQKQQDAAYSKIEMIARNMAELGWKRVFRKLLRLVIRHQDRPETIRLRNDWVEMDPRHWNADMDVTINVGLGTGSRDRDMAMLNQVLQLQNVFMQEMRAVSPAHAIQMLPKAINTAIRIGESAGLRNADDYFVEFSDEDLQQMSQQAMQPPPEDPKIALEREKMQIEQQGKQADMQMQAQKAQMDMQAAQQKATFEGELARNKMQADMALRREQIAAEMDLKREQLAAELLLKREQMQQEMAMKRELGIASVAANSMNGGGATSRVHVGGEPG